MMSDKKTTEKAAKKLAERLGPDWKPHVRGHLGHWYYTVLLGGLEVYAYADPDGYTALLNDEKERPKWSASGPTPEDAIKAVLRLAGEEVLVLCDIVNDATQALEKNNRSKE